MELESNEYNSKMSEIKTKYSCSERAVKKTIEFILDSGSLPPSDLIILGYKYIFYSHELGFFDLERIRLEQSRVKETEILANKLDSDNQTMSTTLSTEEGALFLAQTGDYRQLKSELLERIDRIEPELEVNFGMDTAEEIMEPMRQALQRIIDSTPDNGPKLSPLTPAYMDPQFSEEEDL